MKKSNQKNIIPENKPMVLNITSMTDMFTILLVFLLQNYATDQIQIENKNNLRYPQSSSELIPQVAVQIEITENEVVINSREPINNDRINQIFKSELEQEMNQITDLRQRKIIIKADRETEYQRLSQILELSTELGYSDIHFLTQVGQ